MTIYRKTQWQCRRGMLELDVIFHRFFENQYSLLSTEQKKLFSQLLEQNDPTLFDWLITEIDCPDVTLQPIVQLILKNISIH